MVTNTELFIQYEDEKKKGKKAGVKM